MWDRTIGREAECSIVAELIDRTKGGEGGVLIVSGPAGIGKTRLTSDLSARASFLGLNVLASGCVEGAAGIPLWPVGRLLTRSRLLDPLRFASLATGLERGLSSLINGPQDEDAALEALPDRGGDWWRVSEAAGELMTRISAAAPTVWVVEDMQWADPLSVHTLRSFAETISRAGSLLVVTVNDHASRTNATNLALAFESEAHAVTQLRLRPLNWTQSRQLLESIVGPSGMPEIEYMDRLFELTAGVPLYLKLAARLLAEGVDPIAEPEVLVTQVRQRLEGIDPDAAAVLSAAAVLGTQFRIDLLAELTGLTEDSLLSILREAVGWGLVQEHADPRILEFSHPIAQEAAGALRLRAERSMLHARVATILQQQPEPRDFGAIAWHAEMAGDARGAAEAATIAAHRSMKLGAFHEAALHYERAMRSGRDSGGPVRCDWLLQAAEAWSAAGQVSKASELFAEVAREAAAQSETGKEVMARAKALRASFSPERMTALEAALERLGPEHQAERAFGLATIVHARAGGLSQGGRRITEGAESALQLARASGSSEALSVALLAYGHVVANGIDFDRGCELLSEAARIARECGAHRDEHAALINLVLLNLKAGRWAEADELAERGASAALQRHAYRLAGQFTAKRADVERYSGKLPRARELAREAVLLTDSSDPQSLHVAHIAHATAAADLGDWDEVERAVAWGRSIGGSEGYFPGANWAWLSARFYAAVGDLERALSESQVAYDKWMEAGEAYYGCQFIEHHVRLLTEVGETRAAEAALSQMRRRLRWLPEPLREVAGAWVLSAAGHLASSGMDVAADEYYGGAIADWERFGMLHRGALSELDLAGHLLKRGSRSDRPKAMALLRKARATLVEVGAPEARTAERLLGPRRGSRTRAAEGIPQLSEREIEIAELAARGWSNQQIADVTVLSRRTVENHLARIYAKASIRSRAELAALLARRETRRGQG